MTNMANELAPKFHIFQDPAIYTRPVIYTTFSPIPQVNKTYSQENYFNQEAYKEFRNSKNFRETGETKKDFKMKGAIFDIQA